MKNLTYFISALFLVVLTSSLFLIVLILGSFTYRNFEKFADKPLNQLKNTFYNSGKVQNTYNTLSHTYVSYYSSGITERKGQWVENHEKGEFKQYYSSGKLWNDFNYSASGKKEGVQLCYHTNGNIALKGTWVNGKCTGKLIRYFKNGQIKSTANYVDGNIDSSSYIEYFQY